MTVSVAQVNPGIFLQDVEKIELNLISFLITMLEICTIHENRSQINFSGQIFSILPRWLKYPDSFPNVLTF